MDTKKFEKVVECKNINNKYETLFESEKAMTVKISEFEDNHGKLYKHGESKMKGIMKIVRHCYKTVFDESKPESGVDFEEWNLYVDGKKVPGDVYRYNKQTGSVKLVTCWG